MTQTQTVLNYLKQGKSISPLRAMGVFKITRLASRIHDLQREGHKITRTMRRDEAGSRYTEYKLAGGV